MPTLKFWREGVDGDVSVFLKTGAEEKDPEYLCVDRDQNVIISKTFAGKTGISRLKVNMNAAEDVSPNALSGTFVRSFIVFLFAIAVGTLFYFIFENCTCGHSETAVELCDANSCEETGGYQKSFLDAFYMSCVTLTTVGFGDFAPRSVAGRTFFLFWGLFGVVAVANFSVQFGEAFLVVSRLEDKMEINVEEVFDEIDVDKTGTIDKDEFLIFALLEYGLITRWELEEIYNQFEEMDTSGDGSLSRDEITGRFHKVREKEAGVVNHHILVRVASYLMPWLYPEVHDRSSSASTHPTATVTGVGGAQGHVHKHPHHAHLPHTEPSAVGKTNGSDETDGMELATSPPASAEDRKSVV